MAVSTALALISAATIEFAKFNLEYAMAAVVDTSSFTIVALAILAEVIEPSATPAAAFKAST